MYVTRMNVKVYNQLGKEVGEMELPKVFELPWNADLIYQVTTSQMANRRPTVAHSKHRGDVSGGGRKPWRQKGTGRARHGSIRSPLWKGGGVTHGPLKDRNFKKVINSKMVAKALAVALSAKAKDNQILVVDKLAFDHLKTKEASAFFRNLARIEFFNDIAAKKNRVLVALEKNDEGAKRSLRNLPYVSLDEARNLNALDVLAKKYILMSKSSVGQLAKRFS